jgi:hypothetical protein
VETTTELLRAKVERLIDRVVEAGHDAMDRMGEVKAGEHDKMKQLKEAIETTGKLAEQFSNCYYSLHAGEGLKINTDQTMDQTHRTAKS